MNVQSRTAAPADSAAQRGLPGIPAGMQDRSLLRVLGTPDVTASADGPAQGRKIKIKGDDFVHAADDIGGYRHFARAPEPVRTTSNALAAAVGRRLALVAAESRQTSRGSSAGMASTPG